MNVNKLRADLTTVDNENTTNVIDILMDYLDEKESMQLYHLWEKSKSEIVKILNIKEIEKINNYLKKNRKMKVRD